MRFATGLVGPSDGRDVVATAMVRAMWSLSWDSVVNERAYLYKAVLNEARRHHRDTDDPCLVIGHLEEPLLIPNEDERDGYVPNVVYSCGSMINNGQLVLPYGFSDIGTRVALVSLDDLLTRLTER